MTTFSNPTYTCNLCNSVEQGFNLYDSVCDKCISAGIELLKEKRDRDKNNWVKFKMWNGDIEFTFIDLSKCSIYRIDDYKSRSEPNKNFCTICFYGGEGERQSLFIEESVEDVIKKLEEI